MTFDPMNHETCQEDIDAVCKLASTRLPHPFIVEVGTWAGGTAIALSNHFGEECAIWCVDTWEGNPADRLGDLAKQYGKDRVYGTFLRNCGKRLHHSIFPCYGTSLFWADFLPYRVDLVFIDADHRYEHVKADIEAWVKRVRPGGIICGHDYGWFEGVNRAVDEYGKDGVLGRSIWWKKL